MQNLPPRAPEVHEDVGSLVSAGGQVVQASGQERALAAEQVAAVANSVYFGDFARELLIKAFATHGGLRDALVGVSHATTHQHVPSDALVDAALEGIPTGMAVSEEDLRHEMLSMLKNYTRGPRLMEDITGQCFTINHHGRKGENERFELVKAQRSLSPAEHVDQSTSATLPESFL